MSNPTEQLDPCPFCGSTSLHIETNSVQPDDYHDAWVHCDECDADGRHAMTLEGWLSSKEEAKQEAVVAWNRRAQPEGEAPQAVAAPPSAAAMDDVVDNLREYASNAGYSHNDYQDTMRQAANTIESLRAQIYHWSAPGTPEAPQTERLFRVDDYGQQWEVTAEQAKHIDALRAAQLDGGKGETHA